MPLEVEIIGPVKEIFESVDQTSCCLTLLIAFEGLDRANCQKQSSSSEDSFEDH